MSRGRKKRPPKPETLLIVIIVGGGPSGLSAALILVSCLRKVLVCNAGEPRNTASHKWHGYLTRDGLSLAKSLQIGGDQLAPYATVAPRKIKVKHVERGKGRFEETLAGGDRVVSRMLLLARGLVDQIPKIDNFRHFYGVSAYSCRDGDGWDHRPQPIAVVGCDQDAADLALEPRLWSEEIALCTHGRKACQIAALKLLERNGGQVVLKPVCRLEDKGAQLKRVAFRDGSTGDRRALRFSPAQQQRWVRAEMVGCQLCPEDNCVQCNEDASTCAAGVCVMGNASKGVPLIIAAAAEGCGPAWPLMARCSKLAPNMVGRGTR